jgi:hypothetical protein
MKSLGLTRYALTIGAGAALLAGCGALRQAQDDMPPVTAPGATTQTSAIATLAEHRKSRMVPEAKSKDLLYVSDYSDDVFVFSYPAGRHVGTLTGFPASPRGLCSDQSGDVFVTDQSAIIEYAHGGTQAINTLMDRENPIACAVDPSTGNLAVANEAGTVSVYPNATGEPSIYSAPFIPLFCAYDDAGNLFAVSSGAPGIPIARLPKGGTSFEKVTYDQRNSGEPAGLQWVGKRLEVGSASPYSGGCCGRIYHFAINGAHGRQTGRTLLRGALDDFFVEGATAIVATNTERVALYDFPKGGHATRNIKEPGFVSFSVVVSVGAR